MKHEQTIKNILNECLVFDIETSCTVNGKEIDIREEFDDYVKNATVKWFGAYSYKHDEYYELNALEDQEKISKLLQEHNILIGFNNEAFDFPIVKNNGLINYFKKQLDLQIILGDDNYDNRYKKRSKYMGVNLKPVTINGKRYGKNTLQSMATAFGLTISKGDIDYKLFNKNIWTLEEEKEIKKYLRLDVELTKQLFDITVQFWGVFTEWLNEDDVLNWKWLKTTIASLTYLGACKVKKVEPTFSNDGREKEDMGGRAVDPKHQILYGVHDVDETSKYPNTFAEFGLCSEIDPNKIRPEILKYGLEKGYIFHGNEKFKVKGYYLVKEQGLLEKDILKKLKTRFAIKKIIKQYYKGITILNEIPGELSDVILSKKLDESTVKTLKGLEYAIKIYLNSLYGAIRKSTFEKISTPNAGYDCCWIGQQIHEYVQEYLESKGLEVVGGFTDSWFIKGDVSEEHLMKYCDEIMNELKKYMPFPADTHTIAYECYMDCLLYNYDEKKGEFKKNNYAYITNGKVKIVGFPIMKDNATELGMKIFKEYLEPLALKNNDLLFSKKFVEGLVYEELRKDITLMAVNIRCNSADSYKSPSQLQAQISRAYLKGRGGEVKVIKNKRLGRAGITNKYCTVDEATKEGLRLEDVYLDKVWNELAPFMKEDVISKSLDEWGI